MRVLELFGGYGSQALALENLGIKFTSDLCDIDKYAVQAYNQLHGETFNYGDICSIDETKLPYYDLITYSSPCQDFSFAGKQAGGEKGSGTRSSLLWECERIIRAVKPKYLLMENVKALISKKFMPLFQNWLRTLEAMGYQNWWKVLNAKDYGVPQNRERVFVVSILGGGQYQFPEPIPLLKRLKDVLEPQVDEKYYLSDKVLQNLKTVGVIEPVACASRGRNPDNPSDRTTGCPTEQRLEINTNGTTNTITTVQKDNYVIESRVYQVGNIFNTDSFGGNPQAGGVYSSCGVCPTLNTMQGGNRQPKITEQYRIRKLTPRECWRLMGVRDYQFDKLHDISNSQLYKLAGNSIVVDVLMEIFRNLFIPGVKMTVKEWADIEKQIDDAYKGDKDDCFRGFRDLL